LLLLLALSPVNFLLFVVVHAEMAHAAMKSSMQPCTGVLLQYQRVLQGEKS
jgi:hypothetical protein